ncbi:MAG: DUF5675 family protein [Bacteroidales bacterium]
MIFYVNDVLIFINYDLGNGASTTLSFDQYGYLDKIETVEGTTDIQDWDYDFNTTFGNMTKRKGLKPNGEYIEETFAYDSQDRLLARYRGATGTTLTYDTGGEGNIASKTDVGTYNYNSTYPHQVEEITNPSSLMQNLPSQNITYTKFNKTSTVSVTDTGLDKDLTIIYGPDQLRVKTVLEDNSSTVLTKYYALGMYEKEVHATEGTRELYYINTPSGISAILESTSSYDSIFYIHTDILGSYDVITDDQGGIRERLSFDPWGRRRNTSTWDYTGVPDSFKFDRGFTGHEHLDDFGLINMNGRMYDPVLAMFLSPDPFIQSPHETQNFNRYAYVMNNPLKYTDPSGYAMSPLDFLTAIIYLLYYTEYGGTYSYEDGLNIFGGGFDAMISSSEYNNFHNSWGNTSYGAGGGIIPGEEYTFVRRRNKKNNVSKIFPYKNGTGFLTTSPFSWIPIPTRLFYNSPQRPDKASSLYYSTIYMKRIAESSDATLSEFFTYGLSPLMSVTGYILEPGGPPTATPNTDKRIPAGIYFIEPYSGTKHKDVYIIWNNQVPKSRAILLHIGNFHKDTEGCLLPGTSYSISNNNYVVWLSEEKFNQLKDFLGTNKAILHIFGITPITKYFNKWK